MRTYSQKRRRSILRLAYLVSAEALARTPAERRPLTACIDTQWQAMNLDDYAEGVSLGRVMAQIVDHADNAANPEGFDA